MRELGHGWRAVQRWSMINTDATALDPHPNDATHAAKERRER
ncbi:MAG: hypothetical protein O7A71_01895 [Chloroflexi bacterium]|nr:hypothetical protein [Chloroflexota bacterium]